MIRHDAAHNKCGKMASYNSRRFFTTDQLFLLLYVDDGAIIFTNITNVQAIMFKHELPLKTRKAKRG